MKSTPPPLDIDPQDLARHTRWMRALAYELCGDAHAAEDLVQETWMAAWKQASGVTHLRAWLERVLRNRASSGHRSKRRRQAREEGAARPEAEPSTAEIVEGFALQRILVEVVLAQPSPDREILVLRFYDQLTPRKIGERLELSTSAVRSRLYRALARLRSELDQAHGNDRSRWLPALLAWSRPETLSSPMTLAPAVAAVALVVAVLSGTVLLLKPNSAPPAQGVSLAGLEGTTSSLETAPQLDAVSEEIDSDASRTVVAEPDEPTPSAQLAVTLVARCVNPLGDPLPGVMAHVRRGDGAVFVSDARGELKVQVPWPLPEGLRHDRLTLDLRGAALSNHWHRTEVHEPGEHHLGDVILQPGGSVRGRVVDARGLPIEGARVFAGLPPGEVPTDPRQLRRHGTIALGGTQARSDEDGLYRLEGVPARVVCVFGRTDDSLYHFGPRMGVGVGKEEVAEDLVVERLAPEQRWCGQVVDEAGEVLPQARVELMSPEGLRLDAEYQLAADGRFEFLASGEESAHLLVNASGYLTARVEDPIRGVPQRIILRTARELRLSVVDLHGNPIEAPTARVVRDLPELHAIEGRLLGPGQLTLPMPAEAFSLRVDAHGYQGQVLGPLDPHHSPVEQTVTLAPVPLLTGRVTHRGSAVPNARIHVHAQHTSEPLGLARSHASADADGRFTLEGGPLGELELHGETQVPHLAQRARWRVQWAGKRSLDLDDLEWPEACGLQGFVLGGDSSSGRLVLAVRGDGHVHWQRSDEQGTFHFERLGPGTWQVGLLPPLDPRTPEGLARRPFHVAQQLQSLREVALEPGQTRSVEIEQPAAQAPILRGRPLWNGRPAPFQRVQLQAAHRSTSGSVDAEGRFGVPSPFEDPEDPDQGEYVLVLTGSLQDSVRTEWSIDFRTRATPESWTPELETGALSLHGLKSDRSYVLIQADEASRLRIEIQQPQTDWLNLGDLPSGTWTIQEQTRLEPMPAAKMIELVSGETHQLMVP